MKKVMSYQALNLVSQIRLLGTFAPKTPLCRMNVHSYSIDTVRSNGYNIYSTL